MLSRRHVQAAVEAAHEGGLLPGRLRQGKRAILITVSPQALDLSIEKPVGSEQRAAGRQDRPSVFHRGPGTLEAASSQRQP
jgi:hypothetical protein